MIPAIAVTLLASVVAIVLGINGGAGIAAHSAAAVFTAVIVLAAILVNRPHWRRGGAPADPVEAVHMARRNTRLAALVYAWGGAALIATDLFTALDWYHYSQYGLGAALIALGLMFYVRRLGEPAHAIAPPLAATALHGLVAAAGLAFLIGSGKVYSVRADWAANVVFLWGGLAIVALCLMTMCTQSRLLKD